MAVSLAISTIALSQSMVAAQMANQASVTACTSAIQVFDSAAATLAQAKEYARCINLVYPDPISDTSTILIKILIISGLLGLIFGGIGGKYIDGWEGSVFYSFLFTVLTPCILVLLYGIFYAVSFLFT